MNTDNHSGITMVCCSVFRAEVEVLGKRHWPDIFIRYQNSMLHMKPDALAKRLDQVVEEELQQGHRVLLIYGDCCLQMAGLEARPEVARTRGNNCCDLLLGREAYRQLSHEGVFFLFPEWTQRWPEIFTLELGLTTDNAHSLMRDMHSKLVYLDTGVVPVPESTLQSCAQYCGLPCEVRPVSMEPLRCAIEEALIRLQTAGGIK